MMLLPLLPMIGIAIQSSVRYAFALNSLYTLEESNMALAHGRAVTHLIAAIEEERSEVILFISSNGTIHVKPLSERYNTTDAKLEEFKAWPEVSSRTVAFYNRRTFLTVLQQHREHITITSSTSTELEFYNMAIDAFMNWLILKVDFEKSMDLWPYLMTYKELIKCSNRISLQKSLGEAYFVRGGLNHFEHVLFVRARKVANDLLSSSSIYDPNVKMLLQKYYNNSTEEVANIKSLTAEIVKNQAVGPNLIFGETWLSNMTDYLKTIRTIDEFQLGKVDDEIQGMIKKQTDRCILEGFWLAVAILITPVLCLLSFKTTRAVQLYTECLMEKGAAMKNEKKKTEELLYQMIPKQVAMQMKTKKKVEAEHFDCVTVFFSDIVNFKEISEISTPMQLVKVLNAAYVHMDESIEKYDAYKVETISDVYMIASGVPNRNGDQHVFEIANLALDLMDSMRNFRIPHLREEVLQLRVGINTGPCVAGVVGEAMPRYCLFGDTVNVAARMQTNSLPFKIQITKETRDALTPGGHFVMPYRGKLQVKGKGEMNTYWLADRDKKDTAGYAVQFKFFDEF
ncbi:uncharacterized protein LOC135496765 [Lineus longissimus]|uniref:uncharacterized protein LOC135496765 n=1 Tax=Lineus longissimus TaxID=88925 RepID=UPI002B4E779B